MSRKCKLFKTREIEEEDNLKASHKQKSFTVVTALCRNLTKVPKLCLVYFAVDKSTCIIETKKLPLKETGKLLSETAPNARDVITVKSGGKLLEAMVIATGGK